MDISKVDQKHLYFLLKDKYNLSISEIEGSLQNPESFSPDIKKDIKLLAEDYPLGYIIGYVDFLELKIDLRCKTLIPRPETEFWVDLELKNLLNQKRKAPIKILDIFCGSGCIGLALLKQLPSSHVTFADISQNAIKQTHLNLELNGLANSNCEIIQSDLFENIPNTKFDYIFANPPYVDKSSDYQSSLKHEPDEALFANDNGMEIIKSFLDKSWGYLTANGKVFMEFGLGQEKDIETYATKLGYSKIKFNKDQFGVERWVELGL